MWQPSGSASYDANVADVDVDGAAVLIALLEADRGSSNSGLPPILRAMSQSHKLSLSLSLSLLRSTLWLMMTPDQGEQKRQVSDLTLPIESLTS